MAQSDGFVIRPPPTPDSETVKMSDERVLLAVKPFIAHSESLCVCATRLGDAHTLDVMSYNIPST